LSANLNVLSNADLVSSRREGRSIIYTAGYATMSTLLNFLLADCCNGMPEICSGLAGVVASAQACGNPPKAKSPARARKKSRV
jgi:ArsR family transcriptional regulator